MNVVLDFSFFHSPSQCLISEEYFGFTVSNNESCGVILSDTPVPLATKIYYSQRTYRLRSELAHLYCEASTKEHCSDMVGSNNLRENVIPLQVSTPRDSSVEPMEDTLTGKVCPCYFLLFKVMHPPGFVAELQVFYKL